MAFFTTNSCKFKECSMTFSSLGQLIEHIEDSHIDNDPSFLEKQEGQQPSALALSYVIKFVTDAAKHQPKEKKKPKLYKPSQKSNLLIGSREDVDRLNSDSDSDDSILWKLGGQYSSDLVIQNRKTSEGTKSKPFICPVPGCKKRYKNVNGMKYHSRNGHRKDKDKSENKVKKTYKCECGKSYRSAQGLRQHVIAQHPPNPLSPSPSTSPKQTTITSPAVTTTITPSLLTAGHVGLSLANGSILLEPCTPLGNTSLVVEPTTPVTPTSQTQKLVTPSTPPTGFTIVTLPSGSLSTVNCLMSSSQQQTADNATQKLQSASVLGGGQTRDTTATNVIKELKIKKEKESEPVQ